MQTLGELIQQLRQRSCVVDVEVAGEAPLDLRLDDRREVAYPREILDNRGQPDQRGDVGAGDRYLLVRVHGPSVPLGPTAGEQTSVSQNRSSLRSSPGVDDGSALGSGM